MATVGSGKYTYEYIPDWAKLPSGQEFGTCSAVASGLQLTGAAMAPDATMAKTEIAKTTAELSNVLNIFFSLISVSLNQAIKNRHTGFTPAH